MKNDEREIHLVEVQRAQDPTESRLMNIHKTSSQRHLRVVLQWTLLLKLGVTIAGWSLPLLCFPRGWMECLLGEDLIPSNPILLRLLGWAYLALSIGYYGGYQQVTSGSVVVLPTDVIRMGIVSNGGAAVILATQLIWRASDWETVPVTVWTLSCVVLIGITASLLWVEHNNWQTTR